MKAMKPSTDKTQVLLPHWSGARATGADAVQFLHGQLSNDLLLAPLHQPIFAVLCSAKGRVLASLVCIKCSNDEVVLLSKSDVLPTAIQHLQKFVLRAKVKLQIEADLCVLGTWGESLSSPPPSAELLRPLWILPLPLLSPRGGASPISLALQLIPKDEVPIDAAVNAAALEHWRLLETLSGVYFVEQKFVDAFVPQMLNLESCGFVSFKKGCYPGQEIVARSQFRGQIKRRCALAWLDWTQLDYAAIAIPAGADVFVDSKGADDANSEPCGIVLQSALDPQSKRLWLLLVASTDALNGKELPHQTPQFPQLRVGAERHLLTQHPLPYALRDDL